MKKSKFNLTALNSTTGDAGFLIPFLVQPTLPNDTFRFSLTSFVRAQPMLAPLMHEVYFYTQYWFVPYRLLWDNWEEFITGGSNLEFAPEFPTLNPDTIFETGTLGDYLGYPTKVKVGQRKSIMPFRAYALIWNERYRDQDLQFEVPVSFADGKDDDTSLELLSPSWRRDYFTTARPFTQRGNVVNIPVYENGADDPTSTTFIIKPYVAVVKTDEFSHVVGFVTKEDLPQIEHNTVAALISSLTLDDFKKFSWSPGKSEWVQVGNYHVLFTCVDAKPGSIDFSNTIYIEFDDTAGYQSIFGTYNGYSGYASGYSGMGMEQFAGYATFSLQSGSVSFSGSISVRDLRAASALQRYGERALLWGNRYEEFIQREFGVKPRDSRIQRPEYLGGGRGMLQISEVLQTAEGTETGVGTMRGHGIAGLSQRPIKFRAVEHGLVLGLVSIRPRPVYTQGINREFLKTSRLDFFTPELANIGMQEVLSDELFVADSSNGRTIFGYSDRYEEYRYNMPKVTGEFRDKLSFWNMARKFEKAPVLNSSFIDMSSSSSAFKRPFASKDTHSFLMMFRNNIKAYRPIPKRAKNILK